MEVKYCETCKKNYPDDKKFCSDCGDKLVEKIEKKEKKYYEVKIPRFSNLVKVILIIIIIVFFLGLTHFTGYYTIPNTETTYSKNQYTTTSIRKFTTIPQEPKIEIRTLDDAINSVKNLEPCNKFIGEGMKLLSGQATRQESYYYLKQIVDDPPSNSLADAFSNCITLDSSHIYYSVSYFYSSDSKELGCWAIIDTNTGETLLRYEDWPRSTGYTMDEEIFKCLNLT
jgi:predicted nucleic acid-binding Zn ribbon protein